MRMRPTHALEEYYRPRSTIYRDYTGEAYLGAYSEALVKYGWPVTAYSKGIEEFYPPRVHWLGVIINSGTAIALLLTLALISESIIRRREARKP